MAHSETAHIHHEHANSTDKLGIASSLGLGFLLALVGTNIWHFLAEAGITVPNIGIALAALAAAGGIGYALAKHLSVCTHQHEEDSFSDKAFIGLVIIGSLIHTAFDGLVVHEAFIAGTSEGLIVLVSVLFHELVRTAILFKVLRVMGFKKALSAFIVFGISAAGIASGILASGALESLHTYEAWVELISGAIFFIVAVDLFYFVRYHHKKTSLWWSVAGVALFFLMDTFVGHGHE